MFVRVPSDLITFPHVFNLHLHCCFSLRPHSPLVTFTASFLALCHLGIVPFQHCDALLLHPSIVLSKCLLHFGIIFKMPFLVVSESFVGVVRIEGSFPFIFFRAKVLELVNWIKILFGPYRSPQSSRDRLPIFQTSHKWEFLLNLLIFSYRDIRVFLREIGPGLLKVHI